MPPYLSIPHFHLSKLPPTTKVALTCFSLALATAILFVVVAVFGERTGYEVRGVQANFAGDERVARETGQKLETMHQEPSRRAIYDVIHPHSFMMPVIYFILCHLMEMSYGPRWFKMAAYVAAFLAMMTVIFSPLLVWWRIGTAPVVIPAVVVMGGLFLVMAAVPTAQMWLSREKPPSPPAASAL
jgi:hypothetical protein